MAPELNEYSGRVGMYRLLAAFAKQDAEFPAAVDRALADPDLRNTLSQLVGQAFGGYILATGGDFAAAAELVDRELRVAEDLDSLGGE